MDGRPIRINSAARFHCAPDWSWDTTGQPVPDRDLWIVLGGTGVMAGPEGDRSTPVRRGDVFVLDSTTPTRATHDPNDPLTVVAIHFEGGPPLRFHTHVAPVEFLAGLVERLLRCHLQGETEAALRWLTAALDEVRAAGDRAIGPVGPVGEAVHELADEIRDRPGDGWRVDLMADRLHLTPQHLGRLFKQATGRSPKEYVIGARIEAARGYLRGSSLPLKRIAAELGFHDEFHFSRLFHSRVGLSPSEYRREGGGPVGAPGQTPSPDRGDG